MISGKTNILICGENSEKAFELLFNAAKLHGEIPDFHTAKINFSSPDSIFQVFDKAKSSDVENFSATLILVLGTSESSEKTLGLITPGGSLIYNEENELVAETAENQANYFRKIPFKNFTISSVNNSLSIETNLGTLPLIHSEKDVETISGTYVLASQIGIPDETYFESLIV